MMAPEEFAAFVTGIFERWHKVFGHFPYDRYRVVVRGPGDDPLGYFITDNHGLDIAFGGYQLDSAQEAGPPHGVTLPFAKEWVSHEVFHAWNGQTIQRAPAADNRLFASETWFDEGATVYYSARAFAGDVEHFEEIVLDAYDSYLEEPGFAAQTFEELALASPPPPGDGSPPPYVEEVGVIYERGALVAYLLDRELRAHGSSLDALFAYMYREYGLTGERHTNAEIEAAAQAVSGANFGAFFESYVYGAEPLPLDGEFELFEVG
jgi:predicted metalloprotease with PDZ domain